MLSNLTTKMNSNIIININEKKGPTIVIDFDRSYDFSLEETDDFYFDQNNMHYIWKAVLDNRGELHYEAREYLLKTPDGVLRKSLSIVRTM
jgi:hypothetical protein